MSAQPEVRLTPAEYLALERASETRHEYLDGEIFAMSGASEQHALIAGNSFSSLHSQLRRQPCKVYPSDIRLSIPRSGRYTYADVTVVCGDARFEDGHHDSLLNPIVIIEVLSPSTEAYDRGAKFQNYRRIASLRDYLLIAQDRPHIEHYARQPGDLWLLAEADDPSQVLRLASIDCTLALADVYEKAAFDQAN